MDIWGTDYAPEGRGIHFVVYDNNLRCVVDAVCFDTSTEQLKAVQETRYQYVMRQKLIEYVHGQMKTHVNSALNAGLESSGRRIIA